MSEYEPFAKMFERIQKIDSAMYQTTLNNFVENQKDEFNFLVKLVAPEFKFEADGFSEIRKVDIIGASFGDYEFVYNYHNSVKIYAGV